MFFGIEVVFVCFLRVETFAAGNAVARRRLDLARKELETRKKISDDANLEKYGSSKNSTFI